MTITFRCACGKMLEAPDQAAGHRARCKACSAVVRVPGGAVVAPAPSAAVPPSVSHEIPLAHAPARPAEITPPALLGYQGQGMTAMVATVESLEMLRKTRPWVRFISIMMFIGSGLILSIGVVIFALAAAGRGGIGWEQVIVGIFYVPMAILQMVPAIYLSQYASRITRVLTTREPADLEAALRAQKSFWKYIGIVTMVMVFLYCVAVAVMVMIGIGAAMHVMRRP